MCASRKDGKFAKAALVSARMAPIDAGSATRGQTPSWLASAEVRFVVRSGHSERATDSRWVRGSLVGLTDLALSREGLQVRRSGCGAPLAATKAMPAGAMYKRRDAVFLGSRPRQLGCRALQQALQRLQREVRPRCACSYSGDHGSNNVRQV